MYYLKISLDLGKIILLLMLLWKSQNIKESIDKGKFGCGIYIDLRKAFDTVNHSILF